MQAIEQAIDLASVFNASPNPYMLLTPDLRYAGMNTAYLDAVGAKREDLIGKPLFEVFDAGPGSEAPENARQLRASFEKVLATGQRDHLALIHYAMPSVGDDGETTFEDRYWSATHTPLHDAAGNIIFILQHTTDVTELQRLRHERSGSELSLSAIDMILGGGVLGRARLVQADNQRLEVERNRLVELFMQAPGFVAVLSGPDHVFEMHNPAYAALTGRGDLAGKPIREALPDIEGQGYFERLDTVFRTGEPFEGRASPVSFQIADRAATERFVDFIFQPIRDAAGQVAGVFVQGHDVTDTVLANQRQRLMIDELNHRVKNTLATVQSIAMQTARSHPEPATFAESFQARLLALSHTHDLLTASHWEGADLRAVLAHETEAHGATRVLLNGPGLALEPAQALAFGMIFHELATNAAKYGALSRPEGRVTVDWSVSRDSSRVLTLIWREGGGPPVVEPQRRGFGTRLIERSVRHDLAGQINLRYASDGFVAEMSVPLDRSVTHD